MKKEQLLELGYTEEQAEQIIALHQTEVDGKYVPKARFNEVNELSKSQAEQLTGRDTEIANLQKSLEDAPSAEELAKLQTTIANSDKEHALKLSNALKKVAITSHIAGKVHDNDLVMGMLNLDSITVNEDGVTSGLDEQLASVKSSKPFLFIDDKKIETAAAPVTPSSPNITKIPSSVPTPPDKNKEIVDNIAARLAKRKKKVTNN